MTNKEFIKYWNNGATGGRSGHLRIEGENLINYDTIIATKVEGGISLNSRYYSNTTSKIQNLIRGICNVVEEYEDDRSWDKWAYGM